MTEAENEGHAEELFAPPPLIPCPRCKTDHYLETGVETGMRYAAYARCNACGFKVSSTLLDNEGLHRSHAVATAVWNAAAIRRPFTWFPQ